MEKEGKEYLNVREAAEFSGVSRVYLRKLCRDGVLENFRSRGGKLIFISKKAIVRWMTCNPHATPYKITISKI